MTLEKPLATCLMWLVGFSSVILQCNIKQYFEKMNFDFKTQLWSRDSYRLETCYEYSYFN